MRSGRFEDFYDLKDEMGRGTQGVTSHAVEKATGKPFAAKVMHGKDNPMREFMLREVGTQYEMCDC